MHCQDDEEGCESEADVVDTSLGQKRRNEFS